MHLTFTVPPKQATLLLSNAPENVSLMNITAKSNVYVSGSPAVSPAFGQPLGAGGVGNFPGGSMWVYSDQGSVVVLSDGVLTSYVAPVAATSDLWTLPAGNVLTSGNGTIPFTEDATNNLNVSGKLSSWNVQCASSPVGGRLYVYSPSSGTSTDLLGYSPTGNAAINSVHQVTIPAGVYTVEWQGNYGVSNPYSAFTATGTFV